MNSSYRLLLPFLLLASLSSLLLCEEGKASRYPACPAGHRAVSPLASAATAAQAGAATPSAAAAPKPETVQQLIARAEAEYARGQANYAAGHMEAAKDNFDAAFNLLLRGPIGVQNDERLQNEFDKIVEATHELELQALKVGDGFTEQRAEPAPIDEANNITFPVDPSIKAKAQAELANTHSDLPLMLTDPVVSYINYFSNARTRHHRARTDPARTLQRHDLANLPRRGRAAGSDVPGTGGIRLPAAGVIAHGSPWHVAVHALGRHARRTAAQLVGGRTAGSGEGHARRRPSAQGPL